VPRDPRAHLRARAAAYSRQARAREGMRYLRVADLPQWMRDAGAVGDAVLAHALLPPAHTAEGNLNFSGAGENTLLQQPVAMEIEYADPDDAAAAPGAAACPVCMERSPRPDIRAFACAAGAHPEPMCGTCTRRLLGAPEPVCPICRAPARGWVPTG